MSLKSADNNKVWKKFNVNIVYLVDLPLENPRIVDTDHVVSFYIGFRHFIMHQVVI